MAGINSAQDEVWLLIGEVVAELLLSAEILNTNDILHALYNKSAISHDQLTRSRYHEAMCMLHSNKH